MLQGVQSVMAAGQAGYAKGKAHGAAVVGGAQSMDAHLNKANMDAIRWRPHAHDPLVKKYAANKTAAGMRRYLGEVLPTSMPGPRSAAPQPAKLKEKQQE